MLGRTNTGSGGSGGGMGLTIIVDTVRPEKPTHNMIWVDSDVDATSYALTAAEPENPEAGTLWISIGDSGKIKAVSPVGDNWITVYPLSVKQYIDGAWVSKTAKSYQNGEWVDWVTWLYNEGNPCSEVTGGWSMVSEDSSYWTNGVVEYNTDHIRFYNSASKRISMTATNNKIDLSNINTIYVDVESLTGGDQAAMDIIAAAERKSDASFDASVVAAVTSASAPYTGTLMLDVSTLDGSYYIALNAYTHSGVSEAIITGMWAG